MAKSMLDMSLDDIVEAQRREGKADVGEGLPGRRRYMRAEGAPLRSSAAAHRRGRRGAAARAAGLPLTSPYYGSRSVGCREFDGPAAAGELHQGAGWRGDGSKAFRSSSSAAVVHISGLDYSVLRQDLEELFDSIGGVLKVWVDYDRTDRSLGTGGCVFKSVSDAQRAIEAFDGRRIEGKTIHLELRLGKRGAPGLQGSSSSNFCSVHREFGLRRGRGAANRDASYSHFSYQRPLREVKPW